MTLEPHDMIVADPDVVSGQARIRGTRVPVTVVLDCLAAGMSEAEIVETYSSVTVEGVRAAAADASGLVREQVLPLPASVQALDEPHRAQPC